MPSHASAVAAQGRTATKATHHREPWAVTEVELVVETRDIPAEEVAETLGRTLYAVQWARHAVDHGIPVGGGKAPVEATSRQARTYTFIDGDVPEGW